MELYLADVLRQAGLTVVEVLGWRTRSYQGRPFAPRGIVCHHTASNRNSGPFPSTNILVNGRPDLPGPLSQLGLGRDGTFHVIAAGYCNHAGKGGWKGLSGNGSVLGIEAENDGIGEPWPQIQLDAYTAGVAAICAHKDWDVGMVCGHKEWTPQKIDPAGIDMDWFRSQVAARMQPEDDMTPEQAKQLAEIHATVKDSNTWIKGVAAKIDPERLATAIASKLPSVPAGDVKEAVKQALREGTD